MNPAALLEAWGSLAREGATGGLVRRRLHPEAGVDIFACLIAPEGEVGILLEGDWPRGQALGLLPACRGLRIAGAVQSGERPRGILSILLEDERLLETFSVLATDLVDTASVAADLPSAAKACIDRIALWQELFERVTNPGLSLEAQRGLFGELVVLERVVIPALGIHEAVRAWVGPEGANQDFMAGGTGIEVKATISKAPVRLRISNELQLDDTGLEQLFVAHVSLLATPGSNRKLPELVNDLQQMLKEEPAAMRDFDYKLAQAGYEDAAKHQYESYGYVLREAGYYRVASGFPRLTKASLPSGVGDVTYSIPVELLHPFGTDAEDVVRVLGGKRGRKQVAS